MSSLQAEEKKADAIEFLNTFRGQLIVGQALVIAIRELESVEPSVMQQRSNITDMHFLLDNLFEVGKMVEG
jgi:hypothetical protein